MNKSAQGWASFKKRADVEGNKTDKWNVYHS